MAQDVCLIVGAEYRARLAAIIGDRSRPPKHVHIHVVLDNYAAHKYPKVRAWLACHPRWVFHFTPTSASWLNAVEAFFSALTRRRIRRGVLRSIVDFQAAIHRYIAEHIDDPNPSCCGQAHASAIKEAETDAMKRALSTFGNPFRLALASASRW